jgi:hypothetical protein
MRRKLGVPSRRRAQFGIGLQLQLGVAHAAGKQVVQPSAWAPLSIIEAAGVRW